MKNLLKISVLVVVAHASSGTLASSETAFAIFKGLQGNWAIQSGGKTLSTQMSYEVGSNGSIVTEHFGKELSVFYRDRENLVMIHFCNAGNQPRLRLNNTRPGLLDFEMFDITNLKNARASHVERITYKIIDERKLNIEIFWRTGKAQASEQYTLTKI